ncbi:MAG: FGGY-family carbohydrate kinase [Aerococcus sp.]|nr:FGGY-family carbohydrate kinase [Aerococcus sp.]
MKTILSIDVGTTNVKASVIKEDQIVTSQVQNYPHTQPGQIDPMVLLQAVDALIAGLSETEMPDQIVVTTAMHSLLLVDAKQEFLTPTYTWEHPLGTFALKQVTAWEREQQYLTTGTPMHSMNVSLKLKALMQQPIWGKTRYIYSIKDLLLFHLTGEWVIDQADASATGLVNVVSGQWDVHLLQKLGIPMQLLPRIVAMNETLAYKPHAIGGMSVQALPTSEGASVSVIVGTSDGAAANGAFLDLDQPLVLSIGTSHAVRCLVNEPILEWPFRNFSYYLAPDQYLVGLPSNNGGNVLAWLMEQFHLTFLELEAFSVQSVPEQAIFLPYLNGERSPLWQSEATGGWRLVTQTTTREDLITSVIWGVLCNIRINYERMVALVGTHPVGLTGGVSDSAVLTQCLSDLLGVSLYVPEMHSAETLGALKLLGLTDASITYTKYTPNSERSQSLQHYYQRFLAQIASE